MRILLTNDDGISAPGPRRRRGDRRASSPAPPARSGSSPRPSSSRASRTAVSYVRPMRLERLEPRRFAVEGSPADCVLAGLHEILKDGPPDLVISGVNRGHNVAEDTLYSGTVGGAMEGGAARRPLRRALAVPRPRHRRRRPLRRRPRPRRGAPAPAPRTPAACARLLRRLLQRQLPAAARGRGPRHPRHLPGPPRAADLRRAAAHRAERPHLPLADPRPRQRRHRRPARTRANATTASSP